MIGNYEIGADDFASGDGAKVRDSATAVLAALNEKFKWATSPKGASAHCTAIRCTAAARRKAASTPESISVPGAAAPKRPRALF
jgi:hypothetical protein